MIYIICYTIVRAHCDELDLPATISDVELVTCAADFQLVSVNLDKREQHSFVAFKFSGGSLWHLETQQAQV